MRKLISIIIKNFLLVVFLIGALMVQKVNANELDTIVVTAVNASFSECVLDIIHDNFVPENKGVTFNALKFVDYIKRECSEYEIISEETIDQTLTVLSYINENYNVIWYNLKTCRL